MGISIRNSNDSGMRTGSSVFVDPVKALSFVDYVRFLEKIRRDYDRAEVMYERAIEADPEHDMSLSNYAWFPWHVRRDYGRIETMKIIRQVPACISRKRHQGGPPASIIGTPARIRADHHRHPRTLRLQNHPLNNLP